MAEARNRDVGLLVLRLTIGLIFLTHGWPKLIGGGATATAGFFGQLGIPLPTIMAWFVTLLEFFGGIALILGLLVPILASLFSIEMLVALLLVHLPNGWYVVGPGQGGVEFNVLLIAGLLTLLLVGAGSPALDEKLAAARGGGPRVGEMEENG